MIDLSAVLLELAKARPVFHSEKDFPHAVAWRIHEMHSSAAVRLEFPVPRGEELIHLDGLFRVEGIVIAMELKYKTRFLATRVGDEPFVLSDQAAQLPARYDFLKDVERLEYACGLYSGSVGYAVMLTNDSAYWKAQRGADVAYSQFSLEDGRTVTGELKWGPTASAGTKRGREDPIRLNGQYQVHWSQYSVIPVQAYREFKFLLFQAAQANRAS